MDDPLARKWTERSQSPESWLHTAKMLTACAEAVGESFTKGILTRHSGGLTKDYPPMLFGPVFHLLAGYAFEALLKGILVARQRDAITGKSLPGWLTSHNMIALLQQVGVTLEEDLLKFLRRVNIAVIWSGRYPLRSTKPIWTSPFIRPQIWTGSGTSMSGWRHCLRTKSDDWEDFDGPTR